MSEDSTERPRLTTYRGRDISTMSQDELIEVIQYLGRLYQDAIKSRDETWRMWEEFRKTRAAAERPSWATLTGVGQVSEMVDRVAMAIAKDLLKQWTARPRPAFDPEAFARVAIEAMHEPTQGMMTVASSKLGVPNADAVYCWQLMIDEALKPVPYA